ncbi:nucleoside-diphosphate sugar epimerase [Salinibacter sp. 10B]|uniref:NAD-dependent epimerase/dehydratase family protein n=1 Tax=Salinibacter sp. 10B TaxID=1923971 RepID=UPI000CF42FDF|nr:NAD-dependent epimerase/dehydratase family protein [Salinibacter sp. 10B]PQJ35498.1 nucleoside-diphosphate sugar epimerase [Salinibacter sp. 10B]
MGERPTVAIAGATGFIGTALRRALADEYDLIGLTRSPVRARVNATAASGETWQHCDLFDPYAVWDGLKGADYAIYLVHSMLPSARLTQGNVADLDLLQADNFARAAEAQGVEQILYLGALVPEDASDLPFPLRRRLEVEQALGSTSVPLTTLRAGLVVGPGGTWLRLLLNLVRRLPVMVLPSWTRAITQPIALRDVVRGLARALGDERTYGATYDIGGPDIMSYREMLLRTARVLGLERHTTTVPMESPRLSKLWVRVFGGGPWALISPIIDSLRYQTRVQPNEMQTWLQQDSTHFEEAVAASVDEKGRPLPNPRDELRPREDEIIRAQSVARSVQRMPCPSGFTARDIANEYLRWLPRLGWPLLRVRVSYGRVARFQLRPSGHTLLTLRFAADRSPEGRQLFFVTGGLLVENGEPSGRLEFRQVMGGEAVLAAVHDFSPRLPWVLYNSTQALVHLLVMRQFRRHLAHLSE